ncbi:uncharacterized protein LOC115885944 isoform X2 [Sitophilus oryzae]|nr:uncharacterized protein LOC115885944 isoform X2 [Sitophilus oryzae]
MPSRFSENEQRLILKVIQYFKLEKNAGKPLLPVSAVYDRASEALGISRTTVQRISSRGIVKDEEQKAATSHRIAFGIPAYKIHEHTIRTRIYSMYAAGEHITLQTLQANLQNIDDVQLSLTMLGKGLKYLQFRWQSCKHSNRKYLMEQPYIAQKRLQFLRQYKENQISDCSFRPVFLDETWIYSKGGFRKSWQDGSLQTVRKTSGEGVR